ncbi:MAG: hypothetical protein ACYDG4_13235 [Desulfuromonadaceae bacterium]
MNDLERNVLERIGESISSPDVFTDDSTGMALIRGSLNDAIEEVAMLTGSVKRSYYILLRAQQAFYRMDFKRDRFGWITDVWLPVVKRRLDQTDLIKLTAFNPRWMKNNGTPQAYGQIQSVFYTWPTPSAQCVAELTCVVVPERYVDDTDRLKIKAMFNEAAVNYAVGEYYASTGDAKQAVDHHKRYLDILGVHGFYPDSYERQWSFRTEKQPAAVTS